MALVRVKQCKEFITRKRERLCPSIVCFFWQNITSALHPHIPAIATCEQNHCWIRSALQHRQSDKQGAVWLCPYDLIPRWVYLCSCCVFCLLWFPPRDKTLWAACARPRWSDRTSLYVKEKFCLWCTSLTPPASHMSTVRIKNAASQENISINLWSVKLSQALTCK